MEEGDPPSPKRYETHRAHAFSVHFWRIPAGQFMPPVQYFCARTAPLLRDILSQRQEVGLYVDLGWSSRRDGSALQRQRLVYALARSLLVPAAYTVPRSWSGNLISAYSPTSCVQSVPVTRAFPTGLSAVDGAPCPHEPGSRIPETPGPLLNNCILCMARHMLWAPSGIAALYSGVEP